MDKIHIVGGNRLHGTIPISGAKNATLPLMIASLATSETLTLHNVPSLQDVVTLSRILGNHGVDYTVAGRRSGSASGQGSTIKLTAKSIVDTTAPYDLVRRMRASFWVIGPLLARMGEARVSLPGGCAIGTRPVDFFLDALSALGADLSIEQGYAVATARKGLIGNRVSFPRVSVGATHVALMAAALARGESVIENAACEPEIVDLADCLNAMGAKIEGAGTRTIHIQGVDVLHGAEHSVVPDRIETGTYAMAAAMTGGKVTLEGTRAEHLSAALDALEQAGVGVERGETSITISRNGNGIQPVDVTTDPFPGFPTDLQAQFMALMTRAQGTATITETIFENRFMHVAELARLGAAIRLDGQKAHVDGQPTLTGAEVMATDLRASVSLVIAGLAAEGETTVGRVYHLDRGFENLEAKLSACGAQIERLAA
ncbi:MAG: UDP-N-acetylglucosamine 1-carboxyvinyltransferase [Devosiaceae bacterium]|nr:UDP-N-acetylglucosamine 1-carboxyvinyltransferase [Devosiaceae bacterium MH13]